MTTPDGGAATTVLRSAAWYGDDETVLHHPGSWDVSVFWPNTPPPLSDDAIARAIREPVGRPPISELARGRSRPLIIVDDLTRPTPAARIVPAVLAELAAAGIATDRTRILVATGTHGRPTREAMAKKVGEQAVAKCEIVAHDDLARAVRVGTTSFGTPVFVDREVAASDFMVGVGGIYPQHSTGFGGGSKLALGALARRSIRALHYGHPSMRGSYAIDNDFRRDLDEVAELIGLETTVNVHVDADRQPVRVTCGDHRRFYRDGVEFSRTAYRVPLPGDADVVVSNAYPMDVSLTFMRSKGITPLNHAAPGASRIVIAACPEGVGHHGLYPFMNGPSLGRLRHLARVVATRPDAVPRKAAHKLSRTARRHARRLAHGTTRPENNGGPAQHQHGTWLYPPGVRHGALPDAIPGMTAVYSWDDIVERVAREQHGKDRLTVAVYPCAPLQVLDLATEAEQPVTPHETEIVD